MKSVSNIVLRGPFITLGQVLKVVGVVQTGGEAKLLLAETLVSVNGIADNRRGRKLYAGDIVAVKGVAPIHILPDPDAV